MAKLTRKQIVDWHQKKIAEMVQSFIKQSVGKADEEVLILYERFCEDWKQRCWKVKRNYGEFIISFDVWKRVWETDGYLRIMTIPIPKQLPKKEKENMKNYKTELLRIVYIVEGKTEKQRERRQDWYKILFIFVRVRLWIKSFFVNDEETEEIDVENRSENALKIV